MKLVIRIKGGNISSKINHKNAIQSFKKDALSSSVIS
jgi:hypothetical protein